VLAKLIEEDRVDDRLVDRIAKRIADLNSKVVMDRRKETI
jgi:hypothetical protein